MRNLISKLFVVALLVISPGLTYAEGTKNYIGFAIGQSTIDVMFPTTSISEDKSDTAFKVFGGTEVNSNLAVEVGFALFGEATANYVSSNEEDTVTANAIFIQALGKTAINDKTELFIKLGLQYWSLDFEADFNTPPYSGSGSSTGLDFVYGLGAEYKVDDRISVRFDFEQYNNVGDGVKAPCPCVGMNYYRLSGSDVDVMSVAVIYAL